MLNVWMLYDTRDFALNRDFAAMMGGLGLARGMRIDPVMTEHIYPGMRADGVPYCLYHGTEARPDLLLSRQRDVLLSRHFELMGVPVFNGSLVCEYCNDKRRTHQLLHGLPTPESLFLPRGASEPPPQTVWPVIVKPACSHGGDRVTLVRDADEWRRAAAQLRTEPALQQRVVSDAGRDLRVYVVFGQIIAGVMRTAKTGVVSNYKLGGKVCAHALNGRERALAQSVICRFQEAGAPLSFAGIDFLYENGSPVVGEVEDVVGSRMLYQTTDIDIAALFLDRLRNA